MLKAIATKVGIMMNLGVDPASAKRAGFFMSPNFGNTLYSYAQTIPSKATKIKMF